MSEVLSCNWWGQPDGNPQLLWALQRLNQAGTPVAPAEFSGVREGTAGSAHP